MEFEIKNGQIGILLLKGKKRIFITYSKTYVIEGVSESASKNTSHESTSKCSGRFCQFKKI